MHADDFPTLAYLVSRASGGSCALDAVRFRTAVAPMLDGLGSVHDRFREDFIRLLEAMIERQPAAPVGINLADGGTMRIDVYHHTIPEGPPPQDSRLDDIRTMLERVLSNQQHIIARGDDVMENLTHLSQSVAATSGVVDSAYTLIQGIAQQMRDNAGDQEAIEALADELDAKAAKLAQAVSEFPTAPGGTGETGGGTTTEPAPEPATVEPAPSPSDPAATDTGNL